MNTALTHPVLVTGAAPGDSPPKGSQGLVRAQDPCKGDRGHWVPQHAAAAASSLEKVENSGGQGLTGSWPWCRGDQVLVKIVRWVAVSNHTMAPGESPSPHVPTGETWMRVVMPLQDGGPLCGRAPASLRGRLGLGGKGPSGQAHKRNPEPTGPLCQRDSASLENDLPPATTFSDAT